VSISEDGKTVAGGAWLNDANGDDSGQTRIFTLVHDDWEQVGNPIVGESREDKAGYSVSLSAGLYSHNFLWFLWKEIQSIVLIFLPFYLQMVKHWLLGLSKMTVGMGSTQGTFAFSPCKRTLGFKWVAT